MGKFVADLGSVSSGTMRLKDVGEAVLAYLEYAKHDQAPEFRKEWNEGWRRPDPYEVNGSPEEEDDGEGEFYEDDLPDTVHEALSELLNDTTEGMWGAMDSLAPEGAYFGTHMGDGADYGFWISEDWMCTFCHDVTGDPIYDDEGRLVGCTMCPNDPDEPTREQEAEIAEDERDGRDEDWEDEFDENDPPECAGF